MCVILRLPSGVMPNFSDFENAVYNNPHGYGLIMRANGRMQVIKKLTEEAEVDPQAIYKLLKDNVDAERILHLRFRTAGSVSEENLHPFLVHRVGHHETWFAHNGTLQDFVEKKTVTNNYGVTQYQVDENGKSDTLNFVEKILQPLFANFRMTNGSVDISNPWLKEVIMMKWSSASRGILINPSQEPVMLGNWVEKEGEDGKKFSSSNDDYYATLKRGVEYEKRRKAALEEEEKKRAEAASNPRYNSSTRTIVGLSSRLSSEYIPPLILKQIAEESSLYEEDNIRLLSALAYEEVMHWIDQDKEGFATLFVHIAAAFDSLSQENPKNNVENKELAA